MARISGIDIAENKRIDIALTVIYGIGRSNSARILKEAKIDGAKRSAQLTEDEVSRIQKTIETLSKVEGDLRKEVGENIKRLKQIGSYRGKRHISGLPVRGQRTRSNARTKRGRRMTIGALRKEELVKKQAAETDKTKTAVKAKK